MVRHERRWLLGVTTPSSMFTISLTEGNAFGTGAIKSQLASSAVRPGSIVILHDGGGDRTATIKALPTIIKGVRNKGPRLIGIDG
jgi:peptidoglycan-N-acetylglucosamine deacetylase